MKSADTDILILPGHGGAGALHWQTRMATKLSTARFIDQPDWKFPSLTDAVGEVAAAIEGATRPVVMVAHGAGCALLAHSLASLAALNLSSRLRGAYLVAPSPASRLMSLAGTDPALALLPRDPFPFPSVLVASNTDPHATLEESADLALAWGAQLVEAGDAGGIDEASGHGPWPEGMMRFAGFMTKI